MWAFAKANPQFGVGFPIAPGDKPHMQPTNKSNPSCTGVAGTPVNDAGSAAPSTPTSALSNAIRDALGMNQPPPQPPPLPPPLPQSQQPQLPPPPTSPDQSALPAQQSLSTQLPAQPITSLDQQPLSVQPTLSAQPITSLNQQPISAQPPLTSQTSPLTPTTLAAQQTTAQGLPLGTPATGQISLSSLLDQAMATASPPASISGSFNTPKTTSPSSFDLIQQYATAVNPATQSSAIATTVPPVLNTDLLNSMQLQAAPPYTSNAATGTVSYSAADTSSQSNTPPAQNTSGPANSAPPPRSIIMAPPIAQQTFTPPDLAQNPVSANAPKQNSLLIQILTLFRNVLLYALNVLRTVRPFGTAGTALTP